MIIAIDGPAGVGKSSVARDLAARLGWVFLDTGAMYRALTLEVLRRGLDPNSEEDCGRVAETTGLSFDRDGCVLIEGALAEPAIRAGHVTAAVSQVASHARVRHAVVALQRSLADPARGLVAEGRDTTTVVFPDAPYKFFLNASARERARRRAAQVSQPERQDAIQAELEARDRLDSERKHSPLRVAGDAVVIETEQRSRAQVVEAILDALEPSCQPGTKPPGTPQGTKPPGTRQTRARPAGAEE